MIKDKLCWLVFLTTFSISAQNLTSLYDVDWLPQTLLSNPGASIKFDKHFGIPFVSGFRLSGVSSGLTLYDIFSDDGEDINDKLRDAIANLSEDKDYFLLKSSLDIFNAGIKINKTDYLSFGMYQDNDLFFNIPRDVLYLGQAGNVGVYNEPKSINPFKIAGDLTTVFHIGLNRAVNKRLNVGVRFKVYSSILNIKSVYNSGSFYTTRDSYNNVQNIYQDINVLIRTAGFEGFEDTWQAIKRGGDSIISIDPDTGEIEEVPQPMSVSEASLLFLDRAFFSGNYGLGIDAGFSYLLNDNLRANFSFEDLGAVYLKSDITNYRYFGDYIHDGIQVDFEDGVNNSDEYWDSFILNLEDSFNDEETYESYVSWRPTQINFSLKYSFSEVVSPCDYRVSTQRYYKYAAGIQFHGINRPSNFLYRISGFFESRLTKNTLAKVTYSLNNYSYDNLGLLLSTNFKKFNFYIATDNILSYADLARANNFSVQLGAQFVFHDN